MRCARCMRAAANRWALAGACVLCVSVHAQVPLDPTRPPASMLAERLVDRAPHQAPQLQSVLLGHGRRPAAVINGELVMVGDRIAAGRLVRLDERRAVIQGTEGETTLFLTPLVAKKPLMWPAREVAP